MNPEDVYGKLLREDENFWYYEGHGEFGVCIPKKAYWIFLEKENPITKFIEVKSDR